MSARRGGTWVQRWRVPLGFLMAPIFILLAKPRPVTLAIGASVGFVGLLLRAWGSGYLRKNDELATAGPYAHTRNPLYLGSFLIGLGFTVAAGRWVLTVLFALLFLVPAWPWLSGAVTIPYDAKSTFLPPVAFMGRGFASGEWPFWTPNVYAGGNEFHSVREWISVQDLATSAATVVELLKVWAEPEWRDRAR